MHVNHGEGERGGIFDKVPSDSWHSRVENHVTLWLGGFSGPQGFLLSHTATLPHLPCSLLPTSFQRLPCLGGPCLQFTPSLQVHLLFPCLDSPATVSELVSPFSAFCSILFRLCPSHSCVPHTPLYSVTDGGPSPSCVGLFSPLPTEHQVPRELCSVSTCHFYVTGCNTCMV